MAEDSIATKSFDLIADSYGTVKFKHGFSEQPDTLITNNLGDSYQENKFSPYALEITGYDETTAQGVVYDRQLGKPAPFAKISVELGAVFYG